ncbi:hypothetical protein C1H46_044996 [Malus baccata]|uniref:Uncharacterized protein n=1 Tax=Malus baccata TaxID=106549 RepID=A0A540K5I5_MALBA|nr:hypothetical protein C1H46_044996 [Malus baccata]
MVDNIAHESNTANECTSMHVPEIPKVRNEVNPSQEDHDVKPSEQLEKPLSLKELVIPCAASISESKETCEMA